jgi:hypothetical protein
MNKNPDGVYCRIVELSPVDALYPYRFTFEVRKGWFDIEPAAHFAKGYSAGTFTFEQPLQNVGKIKTMRSTNFIAALVEVI